MRIYVASSWRNPYQAAAVAGLRSLGHEVYDFKDADGFSWRECDPAAGEFDGPESWDFGDWQKALKHPAAERGFARDMSALATAHRCVMVLPCGRSAHLEAGYAIGAGKPTAIWCPVYDDADLMVKMADVVTDELDANGNYRKGWKNWAPEHIFVVEDRLPLGMNEPTGIVQRFVHTFRGNAIQYEEYCENVKISFTIETDHDFKESEWAAIWLTGERNGIGASRSQGFGTYRVIQWEKMK